MSSSIDKSNWPRVKFGDVVRLNNDRCADPVAAGIERYIGLEHIEPEDLRIRRWGLVAEGTTFTNLFKPGQVLFGKRRAYQRKVAVADFAGVCSSDIYVIEPKDDRLLPELLPFICQTEGFFEHAVGTSAGSLSPRTNWTQLAEYEFALPPVEEQRRMAEVAAQMEAQFEQTTSLEQSIRTLRRAFEKHIFSNNSDVEMISVGVLLDQRIVSLKTGPFGTVLKASSYVSQGHPVINPSDMVDGRIALENCKFVNDLEWERLRDYQLRTDDMIIGRKGDIQKMVFVAPQYESYLMGSDTIRFRVHEDSLAARFLYYFLRSDMTRQWLQAQAYGTIMPGINEKLLARLTLHIPRRSEQESIVEDIATIDENLENIHQRLVSIRRLKAHWIDRELARL